MKTNLNPKATLSLTAFLLCTAVFGAAAPARADQPLVICGADDPAGNTELDNVTVYRGGNYENQLVIRNTNILNDFVAKGAIIRSEINMQGEFIASGLGAGSGNNRSVQENDGNRFFEFTGAGSNYALTVRGVAENQIDFTGTLATFYFNDCETL